VRIATTCRIDPRCSHPEVERANGVGFPPDRNGTSEFGHGCLLTLSYTRLGVPELCPNPAFLAVLAFVAECGISNLHITLMACGFKSPSPHHKNSFGVISIQAPFFRVTRV
jgi:hypothetical protein